MRNVSEVQLRQDVVDELEFEPSVNAAHVGVAAEKGVITLSGHVGSYFEKQAAVAAARRVRGVKAVADDIEVRYPSERKTADDQIARRAVDILSWDHVIPADAVNVTVRDGFVTLNGTVDWHYQKKSAEDDVRKLSGVRGIFNNIELRPVVQSLDVKKKIEEALKRHAEFEAKGIHVTVSGADKVVLEGKVDNWEEKIAVANAAWSAKGVRNVENKLTIG